MDRKARSRVCTLFAMISAAVLFISGCIPAATGSLSPAETTQPNEEACLEAAQGGNLHYHNLVLNVRGEIYFNTSDGFLSKAAVDGSLLQGILKESGGNLASDGQRLFYTEDSQSGALAKVSLDGTSPVRIRLSAMKYVICGQDCLYGIENSSGLPLQINKDGTNRKTLADFQAVSLTLDGRLLYIAGADDKNGLSVLHLDSGEREILLEKKVASLNVSGDWLYFSLPEDGGRLCAFSASQKELTSISRFGVDRPFIVSGGFLYFINKQDQGRLYRIAVDGSQSLKLAKAEMVVDDLVDAFVVCGNFLYYQRPSSTRIYRVTAGSLEILRIT